MTQNEKTVKKITINGIEHSGYIGDDGIFVATCCCWFKKKMAGRKFNTIEQALQIKEIPNNKK